MSWWEIFTKKERIKEGAQRDVAAAWNGSSGAGIMSQGCPNLRGGASLNNLASALPDLIFQASLAPGISVSWRLPLSIDNPHREGGSCGQFTTNTWRSWGNGCTSWWRASERDSYYPVEVRMNMDGVLKHRRAGTFEEVRYSEESWVRLIQVLGLREMEGDS